jgi:outer membrane protein TolC
MRTIFIFIFFIIISLTAYGQEELTLDEAIQIALHKNSTLQKSVNGLEGFESNVQASYGNFLPTLGLGGGWDWTKSDVQGLGTIVIGGVSVPSVTTTSQTRNYQWNVGSNWTLFDGLANFATLSQSQTGFTIY